MKPPRPFVFFATLAATVIGLAFLNGRVWLQRLELQTARDMARLGTSDLAPLRAENVRLREMQVPAAEQARLRADHEALVRLRAELETLTHAAARR